MYSEHRARFLDLLRAEDAAAVIPTGGLKVRNHDCDHRFRPESDFWWLTGFAEPEAVLVLVPGEEGEQSHLFLREKDRDMEIWNGLRLGVEAAPEALGVDHAHPIGELWEELPKLLAGQRRVVYRSGLDEERDRKMQALNERLLAGARRGVRAPAEWLAPWPHLHELRLRKSESELANMRQAAQVTAEAHLAAMAAASPGESEAEIDALIDYTFRRRGCTGAAYNNIVAGGANACILHYIENNAPLEDGQLLLIDAGAEWDYYAADVTRTFPVNGTFTAEQRALYEVVLQAQERSIASMAPGAPFEQAHNVAVEALVEGLVELGLLEGSVEQAIEDERYRRFYMHRTGHWLGLDVHDCGSYHADDGSSRLLEAGMVATVEPGLYISASDETVEARWRGLGIRIEDDVLVTADGHEVLTHAIPKGVDELEAACQGASLQTAP